MPNRRTPPRTLQILVLAVALTASTAGAASARLGMDPSFGRDGWRLTDFANRADRADDVAIQQNGKIVVAGTNLRDGGRAVIVRFNPDGSLDHGFGRGGKVRVNFGRGLQAYAAGVEIQANGRIVVGGSVKRDATGFDFAVARYTRRGRVDKTFSKDGKVTSDISGRGDFAKSLALAPDGDIVVVGYDRTDAVEILRLQRNGRREETFADHGRFRLATGLLPMDVAVDAASRVLIAGHFDQDPDPFEWDFVYAAARLTEAGVADP